MEIRFQNSPKETMEMNTEQLRQNFLMQGLMVEDKLKLVYSHYDRVISGGAMPVKKPLKLHIHEELKAEFFLERREIGIINVGGEGAIIADGKEFSLRKLDCVYLGKGTKDVEFRRVFHYMGQPRETRHIVVSNHEAVVSPPWSMHFGCGTSSYSFIWGMAGENQVFTDMDPVPLATIE